MKQVMIVDDHAQLRAVVRTFLERKADLVVVADTGDSTEAVSLVYQFQPDVLLVDLMMRPLSGLEIIRQVRALNLPRYICILVLTVHLEEELLEEAYRLGANGYVLKDKATEDLLEAIDVVCSGGTYTSPAVSYLLEAEKKQQPKTLMGI